VNHAGEGHWFEGPAEALRYLRTARVAGARNLDVGCFQINLRWHGDAFDGLEEMLDPGRNAGYAARFLAELRRELGGWDAAVGAFHSRTARHSDRYLARYRRIYAALEEPVDDPGPPGPRRPVVRGLDLGARPALLTAPGAPAPGGLFAPSSVRPLWERRP
jgi:hypothetical protein